MCWFVDAGTPDNPQLNQKLGPNLMAELDGVGIAQPKDLKWFYGTTSSVENRYYFEPRLLKYKLSGFIRLSLSVNWRFLNLNNAFNNVFNKTSRSLLVYSDTGSSSVVGNQVTDILCEVNYKLEGRGSYYFELVHVQYIPVRKEVLDITEVQVAETTGEWTNLVKGIRSSLYILNDDD